jgi:hypothetical protein
MTKLLLVSGFAALAIATGCKPAESAADTSAASSTSAQGAPPRVDTVSTTTQVTTSSSSTVIGKPSGKKTPASTTRKGDSNKATRSTDSSAKDPNILGRDSVIRFPIRRLPTASSTPPKR